MEIERKWLVRPERLPYELDSLERAEISQVYICFTPTVRAREINTSQWLLTVKSEGTETDGSGLSREEHEFPISEHEYRSMEKQRIGEKISKTRYINRLSSGLCEEIDVFHAELEGLVYLEIEFPDVETADAYPDPEWTEADVSSDRRFKNAYLARFGMPPIDEFMR